MNFKILRDAVSAQFTEMSKGELFVVDISKDVLWDTYLKSFPEGSNPIFRERTEHDCQCCKQFIRACANVVSFKDGQMQSIWDINIGGDYQVVADALATAVKSRLVTDLFFHYESKLGTDYNHDSKDPQNIIKWNHFFHELPRKFVKASAEIPTYLGTKRADKEVLERSLKEITLEAAETVLELIDQNSLYRGKEHKAIVDKFVKLLKQFNKLAKAKREGFLWETSLALGGVSRIRNTVIGTLMTDISNGEQLDDAVKAFESKVAPQNYKRPTALVTQGMIKKAQEKVAELGIEDSLARRYAVVDDITVNNVLFANREAKKNMGESVFDQMIKEVKTDSKKFDKVDEMTVEHFIENVLPKAVKLELLVENRHSSNFMSLIAPVNADAPNILKWNNNFSWSYNGEVTDSMKERVKSKGGNIDAELRFSIQWNDKQDKGDDLDAHCIEPRRNLIYFGNKGRMHDSSGMLDVDIVHPEINEVAVENITWRDRKKMPKGEYAMIVHCYNSRGARSGFSAQIEFDGKIHEFHYPKAVRQSEKVQVATVTWDGVSFTLNSDLKSSTSSKVLWGVNTETFNTVSMVMNSPNHWDGQTNGNKHWFFILDKCNNPEKGRGLYNEFLKPELNEHRKVFEVLGAKMKTEESDKQLSGLGFSSTQRNSVLCRVTSSNINRVLKINF